MKRYVFLFTMLFFLISMINISFSLLGLSCFVLPFLLKKIFKKNVWCIDLCPRKSFLYHIHSKFSLKLKKPKWLNWKDVKQFMVAYLTINLFFATASSLAIYFGKSPDFLPFDHVRFMMAFRMPFTLPQLIDMNLPDYLSHFSYRIYSMMFSSTIIGLLIGILFGPNLWCAVCPMKYYLHFGGKK